MNFIANLMKIFFDARKSKLTRRKKIREIDRSFGTYLKKK